MSTMLFTLLLFNPLHLHNSKLSSLDSLLPPALMPNPGYAPADTHNMPGHDNILDMPLLVVKKKEPDYDTILDMPLLILSLAMTLSWICPCWCWECLTMTISWICPCWYQRAPWLWQHPLILMLIIVITLGRVRTCMCIGV